jgi:hypothetical protein
LYIAYSISWALASGLTIFSTILSVLLILAMNEITRSNDVKYFFFLLDNSTYGIGSLSPLILLYISILVGSLGSFLWHLKNYGFTISAYAGIVALLISASAFCYFISWIVSSLMCETKSGKYLEKMKETRLILSMQEIHDRFE